MFKLIVLAILFAGIVAEKEPVRQTRQIADPFNYNRGLIDPYYGNNYVNRGFYNRGFLNNDYYNRGIYNRGVFGNYRNSIVPAVPTVLPPPLTLRPQFRAGVIPTAEAGARILSQTNDADAAGSYQYHYETENGIQAQERNVPRVDPTGQVVVNTVEGAYSYTAPNGEVITVTYTADENGFHPQLHGGQYGAIAPADVRIAGPALK